MALLISSSLLSFVCGVVTGKFLFPSKISLSANRSTIACTTEEGCKLVLVVRTDLKMGPGKKCAQCAHATIGAYEKIYALSRSQQVEIAGHYGSIIDDWNRTGTTKVAVKADSAEALRRLESTALKRNIVTYLVIDEGRTQIAAGSMTVLALGPDRKSVMDELTGDLKLL